MSAEGGRETESGIVDKDMKLDRGLLDEFEAAVLRVFGAFTGVDNARQVLTAHLPLVERSDLVSNIWRLASRILKNAGFAELALQVQGLCRVLIHNLSDGIRNASYSGAFSLLQDHFRSCCFFICESLFGKLTSEAKECLFVSASSSKLTAEAKLSSQGRILMECLEPFSSLQPNTVWCSLREVTAGSAVAVRALLVTLHFCREILVRQFSYSVPCDAALDWFLRHTYHSILSLGAGKAYWESLIKSACPRTNIYACDKVLSHDNPSTNGQKAFFPLLKVENFSELASVWSGDDFRGDGNSALLLCWVPKSDISIFTEAVRAFPGSDLILIGEVDTGSACGSSSFWACVKESWNLVYSVPLPRYLGWFDSMSVFRRGSTSSLKSEHRDSN